MTAPARLVAAALLAAALSSTGARADTTPVTTPADAMRLEVKKTIDDWVAAQVRGDVAAYLGFYDAKHFKGVKRTVRGGAKSYDFAAWSADRSRMVANKPRVAAEKIEVVTWLDRKSRLKPGMSRARFVQRWRSERYADHGIKVMLFWRESPGRQRIVFEDLLDARAGWDAHEETVARIALAPPKGLDAGEAAWQRIAPTGANWEQKLAEVERWPAAAHALARALIAGGGFQCTKVDETGGECGSDPDLEFSPLDPAADLDDPCLRRQLAHWALTRGGLDEKDAKELSSRLLEILALPEPELDLPDDVLSLSDGMSPAFRMTLLAAADTTLAGNHLKGLPQPDLARLATEQHVDAAALGLDPARERKALLSSLSDKELDVETRDKLLGAAAELRGDDVKKALATVADGASDCGLAMSAALVLADKGDASHLPRARPGATADALAFELCKLVHDPDKARQLRRYKEFLPPSGRVVIEVQIDDEFAERDQDGEHIDNSPAPEHFTRRKLGEFNLDSAFGDSLPNCQGNTCSVERQYGHYDVTFEAGRDGRLYIKKLFTYDWQGCPC